MIKLNKNKSGFTIIEVLIACSIISISLFSLMEGANKGIYLSNQTLRKTQSNLLLEEGAEAVKSIRDNDWNTISNLNLDTQYHLYFDTTNKVWVLDNNGNSLVGYIPSYPIDNIFNRTVAFSSVYRDSNDDITNGGGTIDPHTKKVTVSVSWPNSEGASSKSLSFYIADIFN